MKMIVKLQTISLIFHYSITQYNGVMGYIQNYPDHNYDSSHSENNYYDQPKRPIRKLDRRRRHRKMHRIKDERHSKRNKHRSYEDYDCKCSCKNCAKLKQCCVDECTECQNQPNLMYVPYPVPVLVDVPSMISMVPTTPVTTKPPCSTTSTTTTITTPQTQSTQPPYIPYDRPCAPLPNCREYDKRFYSRNSQQRLFPNRFIAYDDKYIRPTLPSYEYTNRYERALREKNRPWFSQNGYSPLGKNVAIKFGSEIRNYE